MSARNSWLETTAAGRGVHSGSDQVLNLMIGRHTRRRTYRFPSVALAVLRWAAFAANRRIRRASSLSGVRCSGLREADAGLITVAELDARDLEGLAMGMVAAATRVGVVMLYVKRICAFAAERRRLHRPRR